MMMKILAAIVILFTLVPDADAIVRIFGNSLWLVASVVFASFLVVIGWALQMTWISMMRLFHGFYLGVLPVQQSKETGNTTTTPTPAELTNSNQSNKLMRYIATLAAIFTVSLFEIQPAVTGAYGTINWIGRIEGHSDCTEELDDGSFYQGGCNKDGQRHGWSFYRDVHGNIYVGEFKKGEKHGKGSFFRKDGYSYHGKFKEGKQNGHGVAMLPSGRLSFGEWKDGEPLEEWDVSSFTFYYNDF